VNRCPHCDFQGRPRLTPAWLAWLAVLVWLLPLGFLSLGFWPFFLLPSIAITAWAVTAVRRTCPQCSRRWLVRKSL
jgi:hypothetical protein